MNIDKLIEDLREIDVHPTVTMENHPIHGICLLMSLYQTAQVPGIHRMDPKEVLDRTKDMVLSLVGLLRENADKLEEWLDE